MAQKMSQLLETIDIDPVSILLKYFLSKSTKWTGKTLHAYWHLNARMPTVNRNWHQVRCELAEVGLLYEPASEDDGGYLDQIELQIAALPSLGEAGYVYEDVGFLERFVGFKPGVIYLPADLPSTAYVPGGTLTDVIRHEYAHAWHWLEPDFIDDDWFIKAFGGEYEDAGLTPLELWADRRVLSRTGQQALKRCRNERETEA